MQPTYLPWAGYFNLISDVDTFIFLDNVQYERGSWQQRNRILYDGQIQWLTVPVLREFLGQHISDVIIDPKNKTWRKKHAATLLAAYINAPHFSDIVDLIDMIASGQEEKLFDLNVNIINFISTQLEIQTRQCVASHFPASSGRVERLKLLCNLASCNQYLSPMGAKEYLTEDGFALWSDVRLEFQEFNADFYPQGKALKFFDRLSIVDVIAHCGLDGAKKYILSKG